MQWASAGLTWGRIVLAGAGRPRLTDPVLLSYGLHAATEAGLPFQFHTGYGDRDLNLDQANPLLLLDFLRDPRTARVPVLLLHCYPFQREAGYLAQAFNHVYFDVGLGVNYVGAAAPTLVAESLELAPFAKQLYSSDAWGPPELHYLGAVLCGAGPSARSPAGGWIRVTGRRPTRAGSSAWWPGTTRCGCTSLADRGAADLEPRPAAAR